MSHFQPNAQHKRTLFEVYGPRKLLDKLWDWKDVSRRLTGCRQGGTED